MCITTASYNKITMAVSYQRTPSSYEDAQLVAGLGESLDPIVRDGRAPRYVEVLE